MENINEREDAALRKDRAPATRFTPLQWTLLAAALACAAGLVLLHPSVWSGDWRHLPGIGLAASALLILLLGALASGGKKAKWRRENAFVFACAALLSLTYALFANDMMRLLNLPVLLALIALALFALCGHCARPLSAQGVWESFRRFFAVLFRYIPAPFRAARALGGAGKKSALRGLGAGIAIALPLLAAVLYLLGKADDVFSGMLQSALDAFAGADVGLVLRRAFLICALGLLVFSCLYSLTQPARELKPLSAPKDAPALPLCMALSALGAAYALFVYVQFKYLFGGAQDAAMRGGYAAYARSGFFELVAVACISLFTVMPALSLRPQSRAVRALGALVSALTLVILASAAWRMRLYIQAYGLSLLRALTLWAMLALLLLLALSLVKALRPGLRVGSWMLALTLGLWVAFNYGNVDALIARYNVAAHARGELEQLDAGYLGNLSPEVLPALAGTPGEAEAKKALTDAYPAAWYDWAFSWLRVERPQ